MSLFGALYVGTSGLQSSQEALNVVAHNVTNTDTQGYVRQQVSYNTREYNSLTKDITGVSQKQTGLGVYIAEVRQVRDRFVDESYRNQYGRQGFYDISSDAIEEIQEVMGELDGPIFYESMNSIWSAIEELAKDPDSEVCQSMLIQYAQSFVEAAHNVYKDYSDYQDKLNAKIKDSVDRINELGNKIYDLNEKIRGIEAGGIENANDYKDALNQAMDELANLANVTYSKDYYGNVLVRLENHDFVTMNRVNEMGIKADEENAGFYEVYWPDSARMLGRDNYGKPIYDADTAPVFDFSIEISASKNTDVGALKALVLARGDHRGNYTDLQGKMKKIVDDGSGNETVTNFSYTEQDLADILSDIKTGAQQTPPRYTNFSENTDRAGTKYYTYTDEAGRNVTLQVVVSPEDNYAKVADSVMMNTMAEFDGLVHSVVTAINQALLDAAENATLAKADSNYMRDAAGNPILLFERTSCEEFDSTHNMNAEDPTDSHTWFSALNICVNKDLLQYPTHLGLVKDDGSVDYETAATFRDAFTKAKYVLNPTLSNQISIQDYYSNFMAQIANSGNVYQSLKKNQELTVNQIEGTRQGSIGVSTDEELSNMIKFQNAYNASSRFINVIDECTEHIITQLGS